VTLPTKNSSEKGHQKYVKSIGTKVERVVHFQVLDLRKERRIWEPVRQTCEKQCSANKEKEKGEHTVEMKGAWAM
jgi:hypothetical protein